MLLLLLLYSPASPHPHPASTSLSPFNLSPAHMHARLSARRHQPLFLFVDFLRLIALISVFLAPALLFYLSQFLPAFLLYLKRADVRHPSLLPHSYCTLSAASASREILAPSNRNRRVAPLRLRHRQNQTSRHLDIPLLPPLILPPATLVPEYPYAPPTSDHTPLLYTRLPYFQAFLRPPSFERIRLFRPSQTCFSRRPRCFC